MGYMESIFTELALFGSTNECARTDSVLFPISEVSKGTVSLMDNGTGLYWVQNFQSQGFAGPAGAT